MFLLLKNKKVNLLPQREIRKNNCLVFERNYALPFSDEFCGAGNVNV